MVKLLPNLFDRPMSHSSKQLPSDSNSYEYDVFISYSTKDQWVKGELLRRLEDAGLKCCIDYRDFRIGAPAISELKRAATTSRKTLMVLTPNYLESKWTEFERYLLQTPDPLNKELRLIPFPLLKESCELPPDIGYLTYLNFIDPDDPIFAWTQLLTALGKPPAAKPPQENTPRQWLLAHPYGMPPHFTGRVAERQMLSDWLNQDSQPLLVLRALGGFGKSALTWYWLLHDVNRQQWRQVVWWSFYEPQADFNAFMRVTLTYLMGREPKEMPPRQQLDQLLDLLSRSPVLLVMDGFERELRAYSSMGAAYQGDELARTERQNDRDCINPYAEQFLRNLSSLPQMRGKVLMTTRLRPRPVELTGGALLQGCREEELTQMQPADAVAFFRSQGIRGNRAEIETACADYGYHPLSLRLLSGLVVNDFRNPGDIKVAQRLNLTGGLVQRQHHVLEQSYQSLTDFRRQLLSRIACFRSPVDYAVLEAISETADRELETDLRDLIDRGLLHYDRSTQRFDLHPIVRRYAYDRMGDSDRTSAHQQLQIYFIAVPAVEKVQTLADLAPVIELYHHMVRSGQYDEAFVLFRDRIEQATYYQLGAYSLRIELLRALFPQGEDHLPQLQDQGNQAWTLTALANSYSLNGQPAQAVPLFEQQNAIQEQQGNKKNWAIGLGNLAYMVQLPIGALQAAEANLRRRIALCQEIEDEFREAVGHQELGRLLAYRGVGAEAALDKALGLFEKGNQVQGQGPTWDYRSLSALLRVRIGDTQAAATALAAAERSLELADEFARTNYPVERFYVRSHWLLGAAHRVNGNLEQSDHHLSEAMTRCRAINLVDTEADILLDLARLRVDQGQPEEALCLAAEAEAIAERSGYVLQGADVQLFLAEQALARGNHPEALKYAQKARQLATCDGGEYTYKVTYEAAGRLLQQLS
ncbi:MAG: toll/interleukin-1 receptor domain-containing protein [Drouetiella hepatica Uher 2000/2452]|uniref:Toll/interleukin-1 receptor domain-containing protein n=1 Tax=Drouetiella hepatica Uher 2000/2452 TaxID=904376 RepID=A0A951QF15_9CYAN|nr:toll/interleukin-1 receptor domain-containing protein [Drouetiella hepatica Uher 2000/2452]